MSDNPHREQTVKETTAAPQAPRRRRRLRYGAALGFLVLLFAVIGVISTVSGTVRWIQKRQDDEPLRQELALFLNPVMQLCPQAFDDAGTATDQSTLIMSAVYDIAETERIRQLREKDDTCTYELEETQWRMVVPQEEVEAAFASLFGDKAIRTHKSVGEAEYDSQKKCYYVPLTVSSSAYVPVLDTVRRHGDTYTVRVSYVANADVQVDDFGNTVAPTADMGKYAQIFTVQRNQDTSLTLVSVREAAVK